jgi:hypothetical protein
VSQLALDFDPGRPNPNAAFLNADGTPKRLLWCSDEARLGGPCPYATGSGRERFKPDGPCCKEIPEAVEFQAGVADRVAANRALGG